MDPPARLIHRKERNENSQHTVLVASGSHIDTVMGGGRYDGMLGVVAALEAAQSIY